MRREEGKKAEREERREMGRKGEERESEERRGNWEGREEILREKLGGCTPSGCCSPGECSRH